MFRSEAQRGLVYAVLVQHLPGGLDRWMSSTESGHPRPSDEAHEAIEKGAPLSSGEMLMLRAAIDVWNGGGKLELGRAMDTLDGKRLRLLGEFLVAFSESSGAITRWIDANLGE